VKGGTSRQAKLRLYFHEDPCVACGGTIGSLIDGSDVVIHALCQARQIGGLPTPCLGHICPVCDANPAGMAGGECSGCGGRCIVGREGMPRTSPPDKRYDHSGATIRARNALHAHSKPCKACGGTVGTLSSEIEGETIHAVCKARRQAGLDTPCQGHPCESCRGEGAGCTMCGGRGIRGQKPPPKLRPPRSKRPTKRRA
jgi:hypothetical protein